jgi:hypothetical protein
MKRDVWLAENVSVDAEKMTAIHATTGPQYFASDHTRATAK